MSNLSIHKRGRFQYKRSATPIRNDEIQYDDREEMETLLVGVESRTPRSDRKGLSNQAYHSPTIGETFKSKIQSPASFSSPIEPITSPVISIKKKANDKIPRKTKKKKTYHYPKVRIDVDEIVNIATIASTHKDVFIKVLALICENEKCGLEEHFSAIISSELKEQQQQQQQQTSEKKEVTEQNIKDALHKNSIFQSVTAVLLDVVTQAEGTLPEDIHFEIENDEQHNHEQYELEQTYNILQRNSEELAQYLDCADVTKLGYTHRNPIEKIDRNEAVKDDVHSKPANPMENFLVSMDKKVNDLLTSIEDSADCIIKQTEDASELLTECRKIQSKLYEVFQQLRFKQSRDKAAAAVVGEDTILTNAATKDLIRNFPS